MVVVFMETFRDTKTVVDRGRARVVQAPSGESPILMRRSVTSLRGASGTFPIEYLQNHYRKKEYKGYNKEYKGYKEGYKGKR